MSNKYKPTRFEAIFTITILLLIFGFGIFDRYSNGSTYTKVEAQSPQTLQIQRKIDLQNYTTLNVVCDKANGYLYVTLVAGSTGGGVDLEIIPHGCQKDPR